MGTEWTKGSYFKVAVLYDHTGGSIQLKLWPMHSSQNLFLSSDCIRFRIILHFGMAVLFCNIINSLHLNKKKCKKFKFNIQKPEYLLSLVSGYVITKPELHYKKYTENTTAQN